MRKAKTWLGIFMAAVFCSAVVAPVAMAMPTDPHVTLKAPASVASGSSFTMSGAVKNTAGSQKKVTIQKKADNVWKMVKTATLRWLNGSKAVFSCKVKAVGSAMGIARYRAKYVSDGQAYYSPVKAVAFN